MVTACPNVIFLSMVDFGVSVQNEVMVIICLWGQGSSSELCMRNHFRDKGG